MSIHRQNNCSEFDWEREIRRDERRISHYYRELMYCLDLPGEEEMIYEQLSGRCSDPVPAGGVADVLRNRRFFEHDDDNDEDVVPPRQCSEIVNQVDYLSSEWCIACAAQLNDRLLAPGGLGIACAYAKLLARIADFSDADPVSERSLRISLAKRALSDLNDLAGALREISRWQRSIHRISQWHIEQLAQLREQLTDALSALH